MNKNLNKLQRGRLNVELFSKTDPQRKHDLWKIEHQPVYIVAKRQNVGRGFTLCLYQVPDTREPNLESAYNFYTRAKNSFPKYRYEFYGEGDLERYSEEGYLEQLYGPGISAWSIRTDLIIPIKDNRSSKNVLQKLKVF